VKKLFTTGSSITVEEFSTVLINGPYSLLKLGPEFASIKCGDYAIETHGEDLIIDTLSEEVAVLRFSSIRSMSVTLFGNDGTNHGR
jgi:hypothetical protein